MPIKCFIALLVLAIYFITTVDSATTPFKHPGILVDSAQLDLVRRQTTRATEPIDPWQTAYRAMITSKYASLDIVPKPWPMVECGFSSVPNYGCTDEVDDAIAAYTHALVWYLTGDKSHANKSIEIMNAWADTIVGHNNSNAPLEAGWAGALWPRAADIINSTNAGWPAERVSNFGNMLKNVYLPAVRVGCPDFNGNWELIMIEATVNIAVFLDDRATFDEALAMWRKRLPAYVYLASDGKYPVLPPNSPINTTEKLIVHWQNQTTFVDGLAQETCRDFGHTMWGFAAAINTAETAWHQGVDLYAEGRERIVTGMEFHANYMLGAPAPDWLCAGKIDTTSHVIPTWEIGYNHYHNRKGVDMPNTREYITRIRPTGVDYYIAWETLTHAQNPNN